MLSSATKTTYTAPLSQGARGNVRLHRNRVECLERPGRGAGTGTVPTDKPLFGHVGLSKHSRRDILVNAVSPSNIIDTKKSYEGGKVVKVCRSMWVTCEVLSSLV